MRVKKPSILKNFNGLRRCEWCGQVRKCEAAHIFAKGVGGGGRLDIRINLIALCNPGGCHDKSEDCRKHSARVIRRLLWYIVSKREGIDSHAIEDEIYRLRRSPKVPAGTRLDSAHPVQRGPIRPDKRGSLQTGPTGEELPPDQTEGRIDF